MEKYELSKFKKILENMDNKKFTFIKVSIVNQLIEVDYSLSVIEFIYVMNKAINLNYINKDQGYILYSDNEKFIFTYNKNIVMELEHKELESVIEEQKEQK